MLAKHFQWNSFRLFSLFKLAHKFSFVPQDENKITKSSFSTQSASHKVESRRRISDSIKFSCRSRYAFRFYFDNKRSSCCIFDAFSDTKRASATFPRFHLGSVLNLAARTTRAKEKKPKIYEISHYPFLLFLTLSLYS